jgi:alpha-2-macroglobulin
VLGAMRFAAGVRTDVYSDAMTRDALLLYVIARHFPERLPMLRADVLETLVDRISKGMYHSLSAGTTLLALEAYARALPAEAAQQLAIAEILRDKRLRALTLPATLVPKADFSGEAAALRFTSGSALNAYYVVAQSGFDRAPPKQAIREGFEILREYTDNAGKPLTSIALGQQVDVHLKFRAVDDRAFTNVALVDLLPGGFELVIPPQEASATLYQAPSEAREDDYERSQAPAEAYRGWSCQFCVARAAPNLQYADPREDRVVFYGRVDRNVQEIVYRIKATNVGRYAVPPAYGEAMYERSVRARSAAGKIEVTR